MKYLGIDYGESKVGLAIGDDESHLALPYKIIRNSGWEKLFSDLADIIKAENIEAIIVGLPLNIQAQDTQQTASTRKFFERLKELNSDLTIEFHDERFTSQEAQKLGAGQQDDDVASMLMLQNYLDANL